jgi:hypothetical protein
MQIDKLLRQLDSIVSHLISQKTLPLKVIRFADSLAATLLRDVDKRSVNIYISRWKSLFSNNIVEYHQFVPPVFAYLVLINIVKSQDTNLNKLYLYNC